MALDSFDLYLAGWGFKTFNPNSRDAAQAENLSALQAAVQVSESALGYSLGLIDQTTSTPPKSRANPTATLAPLVLLGPDSPPPGLPFQRYHAAFYVPTWAGELMRSIGSPVQLARPAFVAASYLHLSLRRRQEARRPGRGSRGEPGAARRRR